MGLTSKNLLKDMLQVINKKNGNQIFAEMPEYKKIADIWSEVNLVLLNNYMQRIETYVKAHNEYE
jgi:hypothetical protein